ncbi:MAG TPA: DUF5916 domain-containing protein [Gemmatimonadales bacterium]
MYLALLVFLQVPEPGVLGSQLPLHRNRRIAPAVAAVRAAAPRMDGILDDPGWVTAHPVTEFRRDVPSDGLPATEGSEIRVLYDDHNLYVGARLFHRDRAGVSRRLSRRDSFSVFNDVFFVLLDSYHDHSTAFVFGVTPAGERRDAIQSGDGATLDASWDPVWEARTRVDSLGWTVEMRIPFSQVRFPNVPEQVWGVQFRRDIRAAGEAVDWSWSPRTESGSTSKYGHLLGLSRIPQPRRIEAVPYIGGQWRFTEGADPSNPFDDGSVYQTTAGLDLKYGLTSNLTLDATINPDFGQVEADPAVVNLTAFETFFEERRPFFVERADLFRFRSSGAQNFFYSRRIGRAPSLSAEGAAPYTDQPGATTILGAAKVTGRTSSGWSVGLLETVAAKERAELARPGEALPAVGVEPLSNYAVARVRREYTGGSSFVGGILTAVNRRLDEPEFGLLRSAAYSGGVDFQHRFRGNAFELEGSLGGSWIRGSESAMLAAQAAPARYYQRPDQDYVSLDSNATNLGGTAGNLIFRKAGGDWRYGVSGSYTSPGFEVNDIGFQTEADRIRFSGSLERLWLTPGRLFRSFSSQVFLSQWYNFGGTNLNREVNAVAQGSFLNLWSVFAEAGGNFQSRDDRVTRGGPLGVRPAAAYVALGAASDSRKSLRGELTAWYSWSEVGGWGWALDPRITFRPQGAFDLTLQMSWRRNQADAFYVTQAPDPAAAATFGGRYVFGSLGQQSLNTTLRLNWVLSPNLSLQWYAQPLLATGDYNGFKALERPSAYRFQTYGENASTLDFDPETLQYTADADGDGPAVPIRFGNPDFRIRSLRSNVVLRWEYRPGSTLFLVWNHNRGSQIFDPSWGGLDDLWGLRTDPQQNILQIKLNYYLNR